VNVCWCAPMVDRQTTFLIALALILNAAVRKQFIIFVFFSQPGCVF
jgi:hypothetical protein